MKIFPPFTYTRYSKGILDSGNEGGKNRQHLIFEDEFKTLIMKCYLVIKFSPGGEKILTYWSFY